MRNHRRSDVAEDKEEWTGERLVEVIQTEGQRVNSGTKRKETSGSQWESLRYVWLESREKMGTGGIEAVFEAMLAKNFLKLIKAIKLWIKTYFELLGLYVWRNKNKIHKRRNRPSE